MNKEVSYEVVIPNDFCFGGVEEKYLKNYTLYYYIINHLKIKFDLVNEISTDKDGDCYYHNLSYYFRDSQNYDNFFLDSFFINIAMILEEK
jgi:hypothetical protein